MTKLEQRVHREAMRWFRRNWAGATGNYSGPLWKACFAAALREKPKRKPPLKAVPFATNVRRII